MGSADSGYELIDFGGGRKLERFGPHVLDRPAPAAERLVAADPRGWWSTARYDRRSGEKAEWSFVGGELGEWPIEFHGLTLSLKPTPFGHVGLFPEHAAFWGWMTERMRSAAEPVRLLNLFAYTGATTLAAAKAGASVTHVDAAHNVVKWARRNAELSWYRLARVRWIAEDAMRFAKRELRRGNWYNAIVLDPPSYGHGPSGGSWKIETDLPALLEVCARLLTEAAFVLLTAHSGGYDGVRLAELLRAALPPPMRDLVRGETLAIEARDGRRLPCGAAARWPAPSP